MLRVEEGDGGCGRLHELVDSKGRAGVVLVDRSEDGEDLGVKASVAKTEEEGADDGEVLVGQSKKANIYK